MYVVGYHLSYQLSQLFSISLDVSGCNPIFKSICLHSNKLFCVFWAWALFSSGFWWRMYGRITRYLLYTLQYYNNILVQYNILIIVHYMLIVGHIYSFLRLGLDRRPTNYNTHWTFLLKQLCNIACVSKWSELQLILWSPVRSKNSLHILYIEKVEQ